MAELPRYRQVGIEPIQPRQTARPDLQESVARSNMINQEIGQMTQFLDQKIGLQKQKELQALDIQRTTEGQQIVSQIGDEAVLEQLTAQGGPKNISDRAAYALANQVASDRIESAATLEFKRISEQAWLAKVPYPNVNSQFQDAVDGFSASLANLDPVTATRVRQRLSNVAATYNNDYLSKYANLQQQAESVNTIQYVDVAQSSIVNNIMNTGLTQEVLDEVQILKDKIKRAPELSEQTKDTYIREIDNNVAQEDIRFTVNSLPVNERRAYIDSWRDDAIAYMNPPQIRSFLNQLQTETQGVINVRNGEVNTNIKDRIAHAKENPGTVVEIDPNELAYLTESQLNEFEVDLSIINAYPDLSGMSLGELEATSIQAKESLNDPSTEDFVRRQEIVTGVTETIETIIQKRKSDFVTYAIDHNPVIKNLYTGYEQAIANNDVAAATQMFNEYKGHLRAYSEDYDPANVPNIITTEAMSSLIVTVNNPELPIDERLATFDSYFNSMDDDSQFSFIQQAANQGLPYDLQFAYTLPDSIPSQAEERKLIIENVDVTVSDLVSVPALANGNYNTQAKLMERMLADSGTSNKLESFYDAIADGRDTEQALEIYNSKFELAQKLTAVYMIKGVNFARARDRAINTVFNETVLNGAMFSPDMFETITENALELVLENIYEPDNLNTLNLKEVNIIGNEEYDREKFINSISDTPTFMNNNAGTGVVLAYKGETGVQPIFDNNGQLIEYTFTQLIAMAKGEVIQTQVAQITASESRFETMSLKAL